MIKSLVSATAIKKVQGALHADADDLLAVEEPLEIRLGYGPADDRKQKSISVTMRTPGHDFELAAGFLYTEGVISGMDDVALIKYCSALNTVEDHDNIVRVELHETVTFDMTSLQRNFYTTSSCGVCGKASIEAVRTLINKKSGRPMQVSKALLISLPQRLRAGQHVFEHTGGLHASALFDTSGALVLVREDVGRHNALDKVIGAALAQSSDAGKNFSLDQYILLLSGRASFELIQKAAMAGIGAVCAVGAPSSLAVSLAKESGMTLIGFLRENRFNIYSGQERIILN